MNKKITIKGNPATMTGRSVTAGEPAPDFIAVTKDMKDIRLSEFNDKIKVISSFPSIDTPVCDLQVKEFNRKAAGTSPDVLLLGISKDLPFAQKRFCSLNNIDREILLSDFKYSSFGINYGVLIRELNLLGRAIFIIDRSNVIRYIQIAEELSSALDFDDAYRNLENVINNPSPARDAEKTLGRCIPCEKGLKALSSAEISEGLLKNKGWSLVENQKIVKEFAFRNFSDAKWNSDLISGIAEEQGHHPSVLLSYKKLKVTLTTHAAGGLTTNDFIMAALIDNSINC